MPGYRLFVCDPFGRSDPDSLVNYGRDDIQEHNYIFFFDQEAIHLNIHDATFHEVVRRNGDLYFAQRITLDNITFNWSPLVKKVSLNKLGYVITSEKNSENVQAICEKFQWQSLYYFFHGWAALDWYRGYDKTFLIKPVSERRPQKTFISPNRIIGGARIHRLKMLYWIFKLGIADNHISCPVICPAENVSIFDAIKHLPYHDSTAIFQSANLPRQYKDELNHPMHSCWLSLFDQAADSLLYLVTETVAGGRRLHLTEKTFKPIAMGMPFVIVSTAGSLEYLRSYGFRTFHDFWDESYDLELDDDVRIEKIAQVLHDLNSLNQYQRQDLLQQARPVIEHNWNHFYHGGFEAVLWKELQQMLDGIKPSY